MSLNTRTAQVADLLSTDGASVMHSELIDGGIARFRGVQDAGSLIDLVEKVGVVVGHRDSDPTGVTTIAARAGDSTTPPGYAGFTRLALVPHTDCSGVADPPHLLIVACVRAAVEGGESVLVDSRALYDLLADHHPEALRDLCEPRSAYFGGASGYLGAIFSEIPGGRLAVRLRLDDLAAFSPRVERHVPILRRLVHHLSVTLRLCPGEGYVLDNYRWLHGRRAFVGERVLYRVHANSRVASLRQPGFLPDRAGTV